MLNFYWKHSIIYIIEVLVNGIIKYLLGAEHHLCNRSFGLWNNKTPKSRLAFHWGEKHYLFNRFFCGLSNNKIPKSRL